MTTTVPRQSARIYAFVPRARPIAAGQLSDQALGHDRDNQPIACEFGAGWYHEAAIKDSDRPRKS